MIRLLLLVTIAAASTMTDAADNFTTHFEAELNRRGIAYDVLEDGRYALTTADGRMTAYLDNVRREYAREGDPAAITRFLDSALAGGGPLPDWQEAKANLLPMLESGTVELREVSVRYELSDETVLVLVHFDDETGAIRFLREVDFSNWGVSQNEVLEAAEANLDAMMQATTVSYLDAGDFRLGVIEAGEPYKASLIRAPSLRAKVESELGWPIYAVAPSRGFVFLISQADSKELGRVGVSVVKEYKAAEYPISTEIWEVDNDGITAVAGFPVE